jgi:MSHA biogenesis protein MshN
MAALAAIQGRRMSVLNTMLRDLERRGERLPLSVAPQSPARQEAKQDAPAAPIAPPLRTTAAESGRRKLRVRPILLLAAGATAAAAIWLWPHPQKGPAEAPAGAQAGGVEARTTAPSPRAEPVAAPLQSTQASLVTPPAALSQSTQPGAPISLPAPQPVQADPSQPAAATTQPEHPQTPTPAFAPPSSALRASEGEGASADKPAPHAHIPSRVDAPRTVERPDTNHAPAEAAVAPSAAQSELERATQLIARGRATEAAELLTAALSQRPGWNEARSTLAALQAEGGNRPLALVTLLDGVAFDPRRFAPMAAQLQAELGDPTGALRTLDRVPTPARDQTYHSLTAAVAQRAGQHELAVAEYGAALRFGPSNSVVWVGLGVSLQALGRNQEALDAYRSAAGGTLSAELRRFTQGRINELQVSAPAAATQTR